MPHAGMPLTAWSAQAPGPAIRVIVVDDSGMMRRAICRALESEPLIQVVGTGANGREAVELVKQHHPDLVTLDIEMPVMDGLEALQAIMAVRATPVLMLSAHTTPGAQATLKALELGAADFLVKPGAYARGNARGFADALVARALAVACRHAGPRSGRIESAGPAPVRQLPAGGLRLVAIGSSTGGPRALQKILSELPADLDAGVVMVQHMPALFTRQFAIRLNECSAMQVREARDGDQVEPGTALLAPGHSHIELDRVLGSRAWVRLVESEDERPLRPSVDIFFHSVAQVMGERTAAVVLTGMGIDGAEGLASIRAAGGITMAQDKDSCVVYGMPRACVENGSAERIVPLDGLVGEIHQVLGAAAGRRRNVA